MINFSRFGLRVLTSHAPRGRSGASTTHAVSPMDTLSVDLPRGCDVSVVTEKQLCSALTVDGAGAHVQHKARGGAQPHCVWQVSAEPHTKDVSIFAPAKFHFDIRTAAGAVTLGDVEGDISVATHGGDLHARGKLQGMKLVAKTDGGNVNLGSVDGDVDVDVGAGSALKAERISGLHVRLEALTGSHIDIASVFCDTLSVQVGEGSTLRLGAVLCRSSGAVKGEAAKVTIGSLEIGEGKSFHVEAKGPINAHVARDKACALVANSSEGAVNISVDAGVKVKLVKPVARVADDVHQMPKSSREQHTILLDLRSGQDQGTSVEHKSWLERAGFSLDPKRSTGHR